MAESSERYVTLRGGLVVPVEALQLAWQLEDRGFRIALAGDDALRVTPGSALTEADVALIRQHKPALLAIIAYQAPDDAGA